MDLFNWLFRSFKITYSRPKRTAVNITSVAWYKANISSAMQYCQAQSYRLVISTQRTYLTILMQNQLYRMTVIVSFSSASWLELHHLYPCVFCVCIQLASRNAPLVRSYDKDWSWLPLLIKAYSCVNWLLSSNQRSGLYLCSVVPLLCYYMEEDTYS